MCPYARFRHKYENNTFLSLFIVLCSILISLVSCVPINDALCSNAVVGQCYLPRELFWLLLFTFLMMQIQVKIKHYTAFIVE